MKKIILIFALMLAFIFNATAQTATQNSKLFDNMNFGVTIGATTPLDFNSATPLNTVAGLKLGKDITPVLGFELEWLTFFNDNHFSNLNTIVKASNFGVNGVVNFNNWFCGYKGTPRLFECKANVGLGWYHGWNTSNNDLTAKTGVDLQFNIGKVKAHSVSLTPAIYWNLSKGNGVKFNKNHAQLGLFATYAYHFKTSNGTRHFKTYDVGYLMSENNRLTNELAKKPTEVVREVVKTVNVVETDTVNVVSNDTLFNYCVISFEQNSYKLTDTAKATLNNIPQASTVSVEATASPEGSEKYNLNLSNNRAKAVADYLIERGVKVESINGLGVTGTDSQRTAKVIFK